MISPIVMPLREVLQTLSHKSPDELVQEISTQRYNFVFMLLYCYTKIRGAKTIGELIPFLALANKTK